MARYGDMDVYSSDEYQEAIQPVLAWIDGHMSHTD